MQMCCDGYVPQHADVPQHTLNDVVKRMHAAAWIQDRIENTLGQTYPVMSGGESTEWEYRIRPPILKHEWLLYKGESEGGDETVYAKYDLFREMWTDVTTKKMNVKIDLYNDVTSDCFECVKWDNLVLKYRRAGGSREVDRVAAQAMKEEHIRVIKTGHRKEGVELFAARSRNATNDWLAVEFDGIDNSHTHVPCELLQRHNQQLP